MKKVWKQILVLIFVLMITFSMKIDVSAEIIYNTTGETTPQGEVYYAKYWSGNQWRYFRGTSEDYPQTIDITYDVTYDYEEAYKMLAMVNAERRKAGVPELQAKDELMQVAMKRAAETDIYWTHTRPDGFSITTISMFVQGENICAGAGDAKDAMDSWIESTGHYENMIDERWCYAGFGCVNGCWVQIFCNGAKRYWEDGYDAAFHRANDKYVGSELVYSPISPNDNPVIWDEMPYGELKNYTEKFTARLDPKLITDFYADCVSEMLAGEYEEVGIILSTTSAQTLNFPSGVFLTSDQFDVKVLTPQLISYNKMDIISSNGKSGEIQALKAGTAKMEFTLKADSSFKTTLEIEIKDKSVKNGSKVTVSGNTYKVTNTKSRTVSFSGAKDAKTVTIPKTVKIQGRSYKVTSIADNAFKNSKKLTNVTIRANVTSIGSKAFYGCKNLKKITVKSTKLKSIGKNALKGIHKKAVVKVPKSKLSKYKQLFKNKGQKKTVKIKK